MIDAQGHTVSSGISYVFGSFFFLPGETLQYYTYVVIKLNKTIANEFSENHFQLYFLFKIIEV